MKAAPREEFVIDKRGNMRQAGTVDPEREFIDAQRRIFETDLYEFTYGVLGRTYLTIELHSPVCRWLSHTPPYRKLLLLPRRHAKTSIVSHGLPIHILIQPKDNNIYIPGKDGRDTRIMLAGETADRAQDNLRVIRSIFEQNNFFRSMWKDHVWENARRESEKWNEKALVIPRNENYPDPSIRAIGVGGAITGARHDVHIKDDLVSEEAANSELVMHGAIQWNTNSRALMDDQDRGLEFIIGTRWAVQDLYSHIIRNDPTVATMKRSIIENGRVIYPEAFSMETVERLRAEFGAMFALMYMNNVGDPELVDFFEEDLRKFKLDKGMAVFEEDGRDNALHTKTQTVHRRDNSVKPHRGEPLSDYLDRFSGSVGRDAYFRFKGN